MLEFHDVIQNSEEWFGLRLGKVTGSKFSTVMANYPKTFGNPAQDYAIQVALERVTGERIEGFQNEWMERGHELEPLARHLYEMKTFEDVGNGGIYVDGNIAVSPDGVLEGGLIEIKSVKYNTHFERIKKGGIDLKYKWQIQGGLWLTGLGYCDFVSFCPDFPEDKQLYIHRVYPDEKMHDQLDNRINQFLELVESNLKYL